MLELYSVDISEDSLAHYGRMNMKWYQHIFGDDKRYGVNGRDTSNESKSKTSMLSRIKEHRERAKEAKAAKAAEKKRNAEIKEDESFLKKTGRKIHARSEEQARKIKEKAMHSGDPKTILKYMDTMTDDELSEAYKRANTVNQLLDLKSKRPKEKTATEHLVDALSKSAGALTAIGKAYTDNQEALEKFAKLFAGEDVDFGSKDKSKEDDD